MSDLPSLLPPNTTPVEKAVEQATARMGEIALPASAWDPATCPAEFLPWLAWALAVSPWSSAWSEGQKRAAIAAAPFVHRHAGTRGAVDRALTTVELDVAIEEWWETEPPGAPFTYTAVVDVMDGGATLDQEQHVVTAIDGAKNVRSHGTLNLVGELAGVSYVAGASVLHFAMTLEPGP